MRKLIIAEFIVLLAGTIFAWSNFAIELVSYLNNQACATGCTAGVVNPIYTPCFYGAITFTIAFALSVAVLVVSRKR
jgi:hypothetical protein